jgi:hypothetical protein
MNLQIHKVYTSDEKWHHNVNSAVALQVPYTAVRTRSCRYVSHVNNDMLKCNTPYESEQ